MIGFPSSYRLKGRLALKEPFDSCSASSRGRCLVQRGLCGFESHWLEVFIRTVIQVVKEARLSIWSRHGYMGSNPIQCTNFSPYRLAGLGRHILSVQTPVRIRMGTPILCACSSVDKSIGLRNQGSGVQISPGAPILIAGRLLVPSGAHIPVHAGSIPAPASTFYLCASDGNWQT